jgi:hypothetical protein
MKATIFATIERIIETPFVEDQFEHGSVCFERDEEVRADFRLQFTVYDVVNYAYGIVYQLYWKENEALKSISLLKIPYPANATFFWNYSTIGKKYRLKEPIKEMEFIDVSKLRWGSVGV